MASEDRSPREERRPHPSSPRRAKSSGTSPPLASAQWDECRPMASPPRSSGIAADTSWPDRLTARWEPPSRPTVDRPRVRRRTASPTAGRAGADGSNDRRRRDRTAAGAADAPGARERDGRPPIARLAGPTGRTATPGRARSDGPTPVGRSARGPGDARAWTCRRRRTSSRPRPRGGRRPEPPAADRSRRGRVPRRRCPGRRRSGRCRSGWPCRRPRSWCCVMGIGGFLAFRAVGRRRLQRLGGGPAPARPDGPGGKRSRCPNRWPPGAVVVADHRRGTCAVGRLPRPRADGRGRAEEAPRPARGGRARSRRSTPPRGWPGSSSGPSPPAPRRPGAGPGPQPRRRQPGVDRPAAAARRGRRRPRSGSIAGAPDRRPAPTRRRRPSRSSAKTRRVRRYLLPGETRRAPIVRELSATPPGRSQEWSAAVPEGTVAGSRAARLLREQGRPEADAADRPGRGPSSPRGGGRGRPPPGAGRPATPWPPRPDDAASRAGRGRAALSYRAIERDGRRRGQAVVVVQPGRRSPPSSTTKTSARIALDNGLDAVDSDEISRRAMDVQRGLRALARPRSGATKAN